MALVTDLATGAQRIVARAEAATIRWPAMLDEAFRFDQSGMHMTRRVFVNIHNPPLRLVIIGAVHIAQARDPDRPAARAMSHGHRSARRLRHRRAVSRHRRSMPNGRTRSFRKIGLDPRTAMIALTHDPKIDDPALLAALQSDVFYIGALGSKKTQASRRERLTARASASRDLPASTAPSASTSAPRARPKSPFRSWRK